MSFYFILFVFFCSLATKLFSYSFLLSHNVLIIPVFTITYVSFVDLFTWNQTNLYIITFVYVLFFNGIVYLTFNTFLFLIWVIFKYCV